MNIIIKPVSDINKYIEKGINCFLLPLKDFSVDYSNCYTIDEIRQIRKKYKTVELFICMNKNIFNEDLKQLVDILIELSKLNVKVMFYDISILKVVKDNKLDIELVWNQTHMVSNYRTINFYKDMGVNYSYLCKEITKEEIIEFKKNTDSKLIAFLIGCPSIAFSKRKLVTNYYRDLGKSKSNSIEIEELVTGGRYLVNESDSGTSFISLDIVNGSVYLEELINNEIDYIVLKEDYIEEKIFEEVVDNIVLFISSKIDNREFILRNSKLLGDNTSFFNKKTIYKVKK